MKLEEMVGLEVWQEEPKRQIIVGLSGEALEPPDLSTFFFFFYKIYLSKIKKNFVH